MGKPSDVQFDDNTSAGLSEVFGLIEYEEIAHKIIDWLVGHGDSWELHFRIGDIGVQPDIFAMFAASGWLQSNYHPKSLMVSDAFIKRLMSKGKLNEI